MFQADFDSIAHKDRVALASLSLYYPSFLQAREKLCIEGFEFSDELISVEMFKNEILNAFNQIKNSSEAEGDENDETNNVDVDLNIEEERKHLLAAADMVLKVLATKQDRDGDHPSDGDTPGGNDASGDVCSTQHDTFFPDGRKVRIIFTGE